MWFISSYRISPENEEAPPGALECCGTSALSKYCMSLITCRRKSKCDRLPGYTLQWILRSAIIDMFIKLRKSCLYHYLPRIIEGYDSDSLYSSGELPTSLCCTNWHTWLCDLPFTSSQTLLYLVKWNKRLQGAGYSKSWIIIPLCKVGLPITAVIKCSSVSLLQILGARNNFCCTGCLVFSDSLSCSDPPFSEFDHHII